MFCFLFLFFVFDELLCSETLFPSCWRQRKTFFMNTLFFHFLSHLVSYVLYFWIMLSRGQSWHDKRSVKTVTLTTMDSLLVSPRFDSWQHIYEKKNKKTKQKKHDYKWNVTHNRVSLLAHVFLTISGRFCVKLIFSTCQIIRLSDARPCEHVDSGSGGGRHIGIRGRPQPYFGKSAGWDLCHGSSSR